MLWDFRPRDDSKLLPKWQWERIVASMRINENARKCVVFLGIVAADGSFVPYGTGFVVFWPTPTEGEFFSYLVTAKHVIENMRRTGRPLAARLNNKSGSAVVGGVNRDGWSFHPEIPSLDVAVIPFAASLTTFDVLGVDVKNIALTEAYVDRRDIGAGDEVFTVGLLTRHFGLTRNVPITRIGNISAMPDEPVDLGPTFGHQLVYLIESRSIGGLSGSPVFLNTSAHRIVRGQIVDMGGDSLDYIVGVNVGMFEALAHADTLPAAPPDRREAFLELVNAGIAVVIPIQRVVEILACDEMEARRVEALRRREDNGFVPTSAQPAYLDDDDSDQRRDALLLKVLETPPQPRPKRQRGKSKPSDDGKAG